MKTMRITACLVLFLIAAGAHAVEPQLKSALERAQDNRGEIEQALKRAPKAQKSAMQFLVRYMPAHDLQTLKADYLLKNVDRAYMTWQTSPWKERVPEPVFLNNVLPYACINEKRDEWRAEFQERFYPLVKDAKSPAEAAALLNQNIFKLLNVKYSTQRKKADQSPSESIETGLASCTGLSVLLVDACRSVGIPARFVGTPLWSNRSGNHSWVEIWDNGWHFTGAAEPTGNELNKGWFVSRASTAERDNPIHAIYAVSYKHTPTAFPMVWAPNRKDVFAVNVTDRYTQLKEDLPDGFVRVMFVATKQSTQSNSPERVRSKLSIIDSSGKQVFNGLTNDESFDANDHISVPLKLGDTYKIQVSGHDARKLTVAAEEQLVRFDN